jgi:transposase-like protein
MAAVGWQDKIRRQLDVVQQWRQSGKSIAAWARAHGVDAKLLMGWVTYEGRWRQRLGQGQSHLSVAAAHAAVGATADAALKPKGFVAVRNDLVGPVQALSSALANAAHSCAVAQTNPNPASVRIEFVVAGLGAGLVLHWPLAHSQELASWLKSMSAA